ncbi:MAG: hypothetical protein II928_02850 [Paludibacteraceae bacterium]|nr:hypothetical protein [Paludibacteraceae bacterium]
MRKIIASLCMLGAALLSPLFMSAQVLTSNHHLPNRTDSIEVYKMPYIAVSDTGKNCIWDFSILAIDSAEILPFDYFAPTADVTTIGLHREHSNYYFNVRQDTLWLEAYENSHKQIRLSSQVPMLRFPFVYGDSLSGEFAGEGEYSHLIPVSIEGFYRTRAEATGQLILPDITIDTALRVHTMIQYYEQRQPQCTIQENRHIWFSEYCRYPLLETLIRSRIYASDTMVVASTYYFPQEQASHPSPRLVKPIEEQEELITDVSYLPNPVQTNLQVRFNLSHAAQVYISLHYNGGVTTYQTPLHQEEEGEHFVSINMAGLPIGTYVVYIHADEVVVSGNIIKI